MANNPRKKILEVAMEWLGVSEVSKNRFEGVEKLWAATNYEDGWKNHEPYCSAFASMCVQIADARSEDLKFPVPPRFAAVSNWRLWARRKDTGVLIFEPNSPAYKPEAGDIVSFLPHLSHIGIVAYYDAKNRVVHTVEGNTTKPGATGSQREGGGIYGRARNLDFCGEFYRLPARAVAV